VCSSRRYRTALGVCAEKNFFTTPGVATNWRHSTHGYHVAKTAMLLLYLVLSEIPVTHPFETFDNHVEICV